MDETRPIRENRADAYTLSVEAAARVLRMSPEDLTHAMRIGLLPHMLLPGEDAPAYRLRPADVLAYLGRLDTGQTATGTNGHHPVLDDEGTAGDAASATGFQPSPLAEAQAASLVDAAVEALVRTLQDRLIDPLRTLNARQAEENLQLQGQLRAQAEQFAAQHGTQASAAQVAALSRQVEALQAQVDTLQAELHELERLHRQEIEQAYCAALHGLQRRPWWMRFPNLR